MTTDCTYCGTDKGLHHYQTMQCPVNGREAAIGHRQEWMTTTFEINDGSAARIAELEAENTQLRLVIRSVLHVLDNGVNITNVDVINMRDALTTKAGA